jgi:polysaccharide export outer membrane protein
VIAIGVMVFAFALPCGAQSDTAKAVTASTSDAPSGSVATVPTDFVLGADDVMSVLFWRDKELSADVTVRPDGRISLPLLDEILAAGLTPAQLRARILEEANKYVADPAVTVEVKAINSRKVYITGEVRKPGPYSLTGSMTVLQLIAIAGGLDDYAKRDKISIVRIEGGKQTSFGFNYKEVLNRRNLGQNIELKPGDEVLVP